MSLFEQLQQAAAEMVVEHLARAATAEEGAARFQVGARVKRGPDWKWGNQDGGGPGTVVPSHPDRDGCVSVKWDAGGSNIYRVGAESAFDLALVAEGAIAHGSRVRAKAGVVEHSVPERVVGKEGTIVGGTCGSREVRFDCESCTWHTSVLHQ